MATTVEIKLDDAGSKALAQLQKDLDPEKIKLELLKLFDKLSALVAGYIVKNLLSGQLVYRRTGTLARSIVGRGVLMNGVPAIRVGIFRGPALTYAGVIDQGTRKYNTDSPYDTIRPRNAKALAIPVNDALTPAGVSRYQGPKNYPGDLVFIPFHRSSNVIGGLFDRHKLVRGATLASVKASYLLMLSVDIKPRFYLNTGLMQALPMIASECSAFFVRRFRGE